MNKKLKKFFGFLLSLAMVISLFPAGAITVSAAEVDEVNVASESIDGTSGGTWGGIDWTLTSDGTLTIAPTVNEITKTKPYSKTNPKELYQVGEVPAAVNDAISAITGWPFNRTEVKKLVIEEGITSIGSFALQGLTNLTGEVVIPSTVTYIGQEAFQKSSMTKLTFAKGSTEELCIGPGAFKTLAITELILPEDRNSIHIHCWAFNGCQNLKTIVLPANVDFSSDATYGWTHAEYEGMDYVYSKYARSSDIFATCPNIQSIAFGNEEVKTNFFGIQGNQATFNKLSEVTVEVKIPSVAMIGEQGYETLADALAAANAGDTITFVADITEDVTISKAVTIDGAGKIYTGAMTLKADTTIKNVNFDGKGYNGYAVNTRGANYVTIEDCTAKNYGYGFVQLASATMLTTVKNVTASNMNYGVKVDYSNAVVLENADITAGVAAVLNSNYGEKTITIKNSKLNILGTWTRNNTIKTNYVFEGANKIDSFIIDAAIDNFKLTAGATLTAPKDITVTTDVEDCIVAYKSGVYSVVVEPVAQVGVTKYETLQAAIDACPAGGKVTLLRNAKGPGVVINKDISINFSGKTYTITEPVGSTGTESNGFQILAGNKVTLSAGTLKVAKEAADEFYILIQNYADLSCFNMNLDGTYLDKWSKTDGDSYVISNNSGYISLTGKTYITTNKDGDKAFAFDACDSKYYADKPVVFAATTVKIDDEAVSESYDKIEAVARIGSTQFFAALKDAFAYASDGNTIKLMADVAVSEGITNSKKVTLDLNGKTITGTDNATGSFAIITNKGALTITGNGKITLTATNNRGWNAYSSVISNTVGGKLIVESGIIEHLGGTDMAYAIDNLTNGKGTYAETIINGGTIKSTYRAIRMFLNGVEADNILTVKGGTVEGANKAIWMQDPSKNANTGNLTITKGATINGNVYLDVTEGSTEFPVEVSIVKSAVDGKVLTENFPEGYKLVETKGVYSVEKVKIYIAKVGVTKYESLQEAIDACPAGGKVTLLCDAKGPGVVINKNITIVFNGHTYTITEPVGSAGTETLGFQILKGNKVVLNNGKIEIAEEAADKFAILIQNYADLTVYQMTLDGTNLGRYENYSYVLSVNCGKVTVNGKSVLTAKDGEGNYALDVYDYSSAGYSLPTVTVTSVAKINGKISAGAKYSTVYYATVEQAKASNPGKNVTVLN